MVVRTEGWPLQSRYISLCSVCWQDPATISPSKTLNSCHKNGQRALLSPICNRFIMQKSNSRPRPRTKSQMLNLKRVSGPLLELFRGREQSATSERAEPGPRNLLVVDDEESICFSMCEYFSQH